MNIICHKPLVKYREEIIRWINVQL
jgi:hypothetical protein